MRSEDALVEAVLLVVVEAVQEAQDVLLGKVLVVRVHRSGRPGLVAHQTVVARQAVCVMEEGNEGRRERREGRETKKEGGKGGMEEGAKGGRRVRGLGRPFASERERARARARARASAGPGMQGVWPQRIAMRTLPILPTWPTSE